MRKKVLWIIIWLMFICLTSLTAVAEELSKEDWYAMGIASLEEMTAESTKVATDCFDAAGNYEQAVCFKVYARALAEVLSSDNQTPDLRMTVFQLRETAKKEKFAEILQSYKFPSCEDVITYAEALQLQQDEDYFHAREKYAKIPDTLDAFDCWLLITPQVYEQAKKLFDKGEYEAAAEMFRDLNWGDSMEMYQKASQKLPHVWVEADCVNPKTCSIHGETEGEPLGHDWSKATYTEPKTCKRCGITEGLPLPMSTPKPTPPSTQVPKQIKKLSELFSEIKTEFKTGSETQKWKAYAGPGEEYPTAGEYKTYGDHWNKLVIYYNENDWVFAKIHYSGKKKDKYAYVFRTSVKNMKSVPEISRLEYASGTIIVDTVPYWGPGTNFESQDEYAVSANTPAKAFFQQDGFVYTEFICRMGKAVRMWIPESNITIK